MFPLLVLKSGSQNFILSQSVLAHSRVLEALASWSYLITIKDAIPHVAVLFSHENGEIYLSRDFET